MEIKKVEYQERAIQELILKSNLLINEYENHKTTNELLFTSSVASGKTVMTGKYMIELKNELANRNKSVAYLWLVTGKGKLHLQSENSLKRFLPELNIKSSSEIVNQNGILADDVLFLNWESIRKSDNKLRTRNIDNKSILTAFDNKKVDYLVVLIDEAHESRNTELANEFLDLIRPTLILNITATPHNLTNFISLNTVSVPIEKVIQEGFIKKEIVVNENISSITKESLLDLAIKKQIEIQNEYTNMNKDTIPLCLIQIENENMKDYEKGNINQIKQIEKILISKGIKEEEIAVWISDKKLCKNLDNILKSDVKYLIFKQSIATGWDCPRSHILVRFREVKSITFDIQTIGRILRTIDKEHYNNDVLDRAYIYTESECIDFKDEVDKGVRSIFLTEDNISELKENNTFNSDFEIPMEKRNQKSVQEVSMLEMYNELKTDLGIYIKDLEIKKEGLISTVQEGKINAIEIIENQKLEGLEEKQYEKTEEQIHLEYSEFMNGLFKKYGVAKLLLKLIKEMKNNDTNKEEIKKLIISNKIELKIKVTETIKKYLNSITIMEKELQKYQIPKYKYTKNTLENCSEKYAYTKEPNLSVEYTKSGTEQDFANYLNKTENVENWFKNGVSKEDFSVVYSKQDEEGNMVLKEYYPDFIVMSKNKKLYILDVKSEINKKDYEGTRLKYNAGKEYEFKFKEEMKRYGINNIEFSVVKKAGDDFLICTSNKYEEDTSKNVWNVLEIS